MKLGYFTDPECLLHNMGEGHPEQSARLVAIDSELDRLGLKSDLYEGRVRPVLIDEIKRVHSGKLIDKLMRLDQKTKNNQTVPIDPDTFLCAQSLQSIFLSAGAGCSAVDLIMKNQLTRAFCATRPPGHHAERDHSMGFCFFNNIAIATQHAIKTYQINRVAIVDFDVHHGNGTVDIFKDYSKVLICSSFQHPFYPNRHTEQDASNLAFVPLDAGTDSNVFRRQVEKIIFPSIDKFKPEIIMISAGFDAHKNDPLGNINLNEDDFRWITKNLVQLARSHCNSRIISMLEGGYDLSSLARSVGVHLEELTNG